MTPSLPTLPGQGYCEDPVRACMGTCAVNFSALCKYQAKGTGRNPSISALNSWRVFFFWGRQVIYKRLLVISWSDSQHQVTRASLSAWTYMCPVSEGAPAGVKQWRWLTEWSTHPSPGRLRARPPLLGSKHNWVHVFSLSGGHTTIMKSCGCVSENSIWGPQ